MTRLGDLARPVGSLVRFVLARTFVDPVREGRLRSAGWPAGLRPFAVVVVCVYTVLVLATVFASALRLRSTVVFAAPDQSLPTPALPLVGLGATLALACLVAASLHARPLVRVLTTVVVAAILLAPADHRRPGPADLLTLVLVVLLVVLVLVRGGRSFHWAEPVVSVALVELAVLSQQAVALAPLRAVAPGVVVSTLSQLTDPLWALAAPVSVLAGATLVEVTTTAVTWTAVGYWDRVAGRRRARVWTGVALVVLVAARAVQEVRRARDPADPVAPGRFLLAALVVAVVAAGCAASTTLADRTTAGDARLRPDPDELLPAWRRSAPALALVLGATIGLQLLVSVVLGGLGLRRAAAAVLDAGGSGGAVLAWAAATSVAVLVAAAVLSVRGHRRLGLVLTATGLMYAFQTVFSLTGLLTSNDDVLAVATAAAVGLLVWLVVRRRLTPQSEVAIAGVLLLTVAYGYRDRLDEPLTAAVALSGVSAALLVGLVWRLLTDNAFARGDSSALPRSSRVLLALANALVGVTSAALVALLGGRSVLDLDRTEALGDGVLGFPLVLAVVFAGLTLAARGRTVGPPSARVDGAVELRDEGVRVDPPRAEAAG